MASKKITTEERDRYMSTLRTLITEAHCGATGATVAPTKDDPFRMKVIVTKVSRDGMHRRLRVFLPAEDGRGHWRVIDASWHVAKVLGRTYTDDGVGAPGCGMDMRFDLAYSLGRVLFDEGYSITND